MATHKGNNGNDDFADVLDTSHGDKYIAKGGYDTILSGAGDDTIDGGAVFDRLSYQDADVSNGASHGASFDLGSGSARDPWGDTDVFTNIEQFVGSHFGDTFRGPDHDTSAFSGFTGGAGADKFILTADSHTWLMYTTEESLGGLGGIVADLGSVSNAGGKDVKGTIVDAFGDIDKTTNIRKVEGTQQDDTFIGSHLNDRFNGQNGVDSYDGGKGADMVYFDTSNLFGGSTGIVVDLTRSSGQVIDDGFGNAETAKNIEGILGSIFDDQIKGNGKANVLMGNSGEDTLTGGGGADKFVYGQFNNFGPGEFTDTITDFKSGTDKFVFDSNYIPGLDETIRFHNGKGATAASGNSEFYFKAQNHTLYLDTNGKAHGGVTAIAVLEGVHALATGDFTIVPDYMAIV